MSYHQSTLLSPEQVREYEMKAISQEGMITAYLSRHRGRGVTAEQLLRVLPKNTPITSVRRALTNLAKRGVVTRITEVSGEYGRPVGVYVLEVT